MNSWLNDLKNRDLGWLRRRMDVLVQVPEGADGAEIQKRGLEHRHLEFQYEQVRATSATLVDARLMLQIATSIVGIILANILLRQVIFPA
jgi:hypothetical protein